MEIKKNPKADLEKYKSIFLMFGFVITFGLVLLAFEWSTSEINASGFGELENVAIEEEIIPITRQEMATPPPPPPTQQVAEVLNIVEDQVEIEEEMEIMDLESNENTEIKYVAVEEEEEEETIFFIVEEMPEFPGGVTELQKYIAKNIRYPQIARENDIKGKVFVRFCVTEKGTVSKVSVARGVDPLLDEEAIRVVKTLPEWKPGKQRGKSVKVWYTVPINFQLQ